MTLEEAMEYITKLEEHIARQNELILKWTLRLAKEEAKQGNVGTKQKEKEE